MVNPSRERAILTTVLRPVPKLRICVYGFGYVLRARFHGWSLSRKGRTSWLDNWSHPLIPVAQPVRWLSYIVETRFEWGEFELGL